VLYLGMKNNKIIILVFALVVILGLTAYQFYFKKNAQPVSNPDVTPTSPVVYKNTDYGFNFSLPADWQGYSVVENTWKGTASTDAAMQSGPKLLIRNPKWTATAPYEDLPILIFTIPQWNSYVAEKFSVSAAPFQAGELARNNKYVFALPPRWDFDYSLNYKEAEDIIAGKPLHPFNVGVPLGKLNIDLVCENATSYMKFADAKSLDAFVADCKAGKHPEVIEKYKADMNLGDGVKI